MYAKPYLKLQQRIIGKKQEKWKLYIIYIYKQLKWLLKINIKIITKIKSKLNIQYIDSNCCLFQMHSGKDNFQSRN